VYDLLKKRGLRKRSVKSLPHSKNAVQGGPGSKGGFDGYLQSFTTASVGYPAPPGSMEGEAEPPMEVLEELFSRARARKTSNPASDHLFGRACKALDRIRVLEDPSTGPTSYEGYDEWLEKWALDRSVEYTDFFQAIACLETIAEVATPPEITTDVGSVVRPIVHNATVIAEQGCKARIITVPPAGIYTLGDMVRQKVWPAVLKADSRARPFIESVNDEMIVQDLENQNLSLRNGEAYLSADLTKATDGFYHNAVHAVLRGMSRAGLGEAWREIAAESLGLGRNQHYVRYRHSDLAAIDPQVVIAGSFTTTVEGARYVYVPQRRGTLMGTPLSFTILTLINGWACTPLGPRTRICGDDVLSACKVPAIQQYSTRVEAVGSGLHQQKSFYGTRGFTFCEVFGLGCGPVEFFNPYPLKQFMRDGYGVMDPGKSGKYDVMHFGAIRRVCRVLLKHVRAKARRLGRPPELTAALGGLGHPSKGMRDIPKPVRASLRTLVEDPSVNPFRYVTRIDTFFAPADGGLFRRLKDTVNDTLYPTLGWSDEFVDEERVFVPLRRLNADVAERTHKLYWSMGGRYRTCQPKAMKAGKLKLPLPGPEIYGNKTPVDNVVSALLRLRDTRGAWLSIEDASRIRGYRTLHAGNSSSGGSRRP